MDRHSSSRAARPSSDLLAARRAPRPDRPAVRHRRHHLPHRAATGRRRRAGRGPRPARDARRPGSASWPSSRAAPCEDGRRMIPLDGAAYVGTHGVEFMAPGGDVRHRAAGRALPAAAARGRPARPRATSTASGSASCVEEKPVGFAVHYRLARDPDAARHEILTRVVRPGARTRTGRHDRPLRLRGAAAGARSPRARRRAGCWRRAPA